MTDILGTIDATLDGRCACGCGSRLDPQGASMWFASEGCQERYSMARVEGLPPRTSRSRRESISEVLIEVMRACMPLLRRSDPPAPPDDLPTPRLSIYISQGWRLATRGPAAWRRFCPRCAAHTTPTDGFRMPSVDFGIGLRDADPFDLISEPLQCNICGQCRGHAWPGPKMFALYGIDKTRAQYHLRLAAGDFDVTMSVDESYLHHYPDAVSYAWEEMEREIVYKLSFRHLCAAVACDDTARTYYEAVAPARYVLDRMPFRVEWSPPDPIRLCPEHDHEILRSDMNWSVRL